MMGDFYHMTFEETSDMGAFISGGKYVQHVHFAIAFAQPDSSRPGRRRLHRRIPRPEDDRVRQVLQLRMRVPRRQGTSKSPKSMQFLKEEWAAA